MRLPTFGSGRRGAGVSEVGCGFLVAVLDPGGARAVPGDLAVADPRGVLGAGGDLIGDLLALDPDLDAGARPRALEALDLGAGLGAGGGVGEGLAGAVGQGSEVVELAAGGLGGHLRLLGAGCGHAPTRATPSGAICQAIGNQTRRTRALRASGPPIA